VDVEIDVSHGKPFFAVVGLPDAAVQESRERVRSAIKNSGRSFPEGRIVVNLAPADVRKEGPIFDLPIALGILAATGELSSERLHDCVVVGELSLDGTVRRVDGVLPMAIAAHERKKKTFYVPHENAAEAAVVSACDVHAVSSLEQAVGILNGEIEAEKVVPEPFELELTNPHYEVDFSEVKGQQHVKRALEAAAAGGHNVLMVGPPGAGKTMLARRLPGVMPPLSLEEALEVTKLYSVAGLLASNSSLITTRQFRSPHHTVSYAGLVGGGAMPRPGEVSLAQHGVLFLDELPEFKRDALEVLRQPVEDGKITIARAQASLTFPANFMLVAAMNPCPCGFYTDAARRCTCTPTQIHNYRRRISGPLYDRIDIHVEVPRLSEKELMAQPESEPSSAIRERVTAARRLQQERFEGSKVFCNARMRPRHMREFCAVGEEARDLLKNAISQFALSARAYDRILKLARTIADLGGTDRIETSHIAEAVQYRALERRFF
jgi:magnesium chelatase family protein